MKRWNRISVLQCVTWSLLCLAVGAQAVDSTQLPTRAPAKTELHDQYDSPQILQFPTTNVVILTIADRKGSDQIDGWIAALKPRFAGRVEFRGLADCGGAPGFVNGMIRRRFQEVRKYPVLLDWSGKACATFGYQKSVANVLLVAPDGAIQAPFTGPVSPTALSEASAQLDRLLPSSSGQTSTSGKP